MEGFMRCAAVACFSVLIFSILICGCSKPPDELYDEAVVAMSRGDKEKAERKLRTAAHQDPEFVEAHYQLGQLLEGKGNVPEAIACYEKVTSLRPTHAAAKFRLGEIYFRQDEFDKALSQLQPMTEGNAVYSLQDKTRATQYSKMIQANKDAVEKIAELEKQSTSDPSILDELADAYHLYGKLLVDRQNPERALEYQKKGSDVRRELLQRLEEEFRQKPSDRKLATRLAELYYKEAEVVLLTGDLTKGVDLLKKSIECDPRIAKNYYALAQLAEKEGSFSREQILGYVRKAVDLDPGNAVYRFSLAGFYCGDKRYQEGKRELEKIIESSPDPALKLQAKARLAQVEKEIAEQNKQP